MPVEAGSTTFVLLKTLMSGLLYRDLAIDDVLLLVQEPGGDLELRRVLHDRDNALKLIGVEFTGAA